MYLHICASYLVEKMLLANSSNFANVIDKADISFRCSVAFTYMNVPEPVQEISPGVRPYPVPNSHTDFVISVIVSLKRDETSHWINLRF